MHDSRRDETASGGTARRAATTHPMIRAVASRADRPASQRHRQSAASVSRPARRSVCIARVPTHPPLDSADRPKDVEKPNSSSQSERRRQRREEANSISKAALHPPLLHKTNAPPPHAPRCSRIPMSQLRWGGGMRERKGVHRTTASAGRGAANGRRSAAEVPFSCRR